MSTNYNQAIDITEPFYQTPESLANRDKYFEGEFGRYGDTFRTPYQCAWFKIRMGHWVLSSNSRPIFEIKDGEYFLLFNAATCRASLKRIEYMLAKCNNAVDTDYKRSRSRMHEGRVTFTLATSRGTFIVKNTSRVKVEYDPTYGHVIGLVAADEMAPVGEDTPAYKTLKKEIATLQKVLLTQERMGAFNGEQFSTYHGRTAWKDENVDVIYVSDRKLNRLIYDAVIQYIETKDATLTHRIAMLAVLRRTKYTFYPGAANFIKQALTDVRATFYKENCVTIAPSNNSLKSSDDNSNQDGVVLPDDGLREVQVPS